MYYYAPFFLAVICLILFFVLLFINLRKKRSSIYILFSGVAAVLVIYLGFEIRLPMTIRHYDKIMQADELLVSRDEEEDIINFTFDHEGLVLLNSIGESPVYIKEKDVTPVCELSFINKEKKTEIKTRLCLLNDFKNYPNSVWFSFKGRTYCFLSEKILYKNAGYYFDEEFATQVLSEVLEIVEIK